MSCVLSFSSRRLRRSLVSALPVFAEELEIPENGYVVSDDLSLLPPEVRKTRDDLMAAAMSGDIEKLGKIIDGAADAGDGELRRARGQDRVPQGRVAGRNGRRHHGDPRELLDAPYAAMDGGDGKPVYIWPYLAVYEDLRALSDEELVDAYRITGLDLFKAQQEVGGWLYWRVYIGPDGELQAFVAGD